MSLKTIDLLVSRSNRAVGARPIAALFLACIAPVAAHAAVLPAQGSWQADLSGRDLDGNLDNGYEAYYDASLNITWLADANHAKTSGHDADGAMSWTDASAWAASLNLGGVTGWRLPSAKYATCSGNGYLQSQCGYFSDPASSEMSHMYFVTLGNARQTSTINLDANNTGPFANVKDSWGSYYFDSVTGVKGAWTFNFTNGNQEPDYTYREHQAWAVHAGDVGAVPEPQTWATMLLGLLGMTVVARRRSQTGR